MCLNKKKGNDETLISSSEPNEECEIIPAGDSAENCGSEIDLVSQKNVVKIEKNDKWLYNQIASQINDMMTAVLTNGDDENTKAFQLKRDSGTYHHLSVANILGDGNCLFAAVAHQLFKYAINCTNHKKAIKQLRAKVVEYILANFPPFEFILKDRIYELKAASEISDITTECKSYVRDVLSRNGEYGGFETIQALSEIYKINIITFLEDDTFSFHNKENVCNKTIALAYRFGYEQGQRVRNHY